MTDLDQLKKHESVQRLYLSRLKFRKDGREFVAACPNHADKTPSLKVYQDSDGTWLFKCFGACRRSGNIMQFLEMVDKITFKAAVKVVEEHAGKSWESARESVEQTFKPAVEDRKEYKTFTLAEYGRMERKLAETPAAQEWLQRERGINYATAKKLRLGYAQSVGKAAGEKNQDIADKGWIAFPSIEDGVVVGIKYRSIVRKVFCRQSGMRTALFNTSAIDPLETLYVVEGEFDAAALVQAGYYAVSLPSASTNLTPEMKDRIMQADTIILAGDCDGGAGDDAMNRLWNELQERTYLLKWPEGCKDANDAWLKHAKRDLSGFRTLVDDLTIKAKSTPMPSIFSLQESMLVSNRTNVVDHPRRLRFPWPAVDQMAIVLPGGVVSVLATNTGQGKTCWVTNFSVHGARKHGEVVLNYQCELSEEELATMVASHVLRKHRNTLSSDDMKKAASLLSGVKYYIGRNPTLNTVGPVLDLLEAAARRLSPTMIILDHLHFICRNERDEIQAQANAMQRLKNIAVKYRCKVVVVGQPRKANAKDKGKVLHITDAKGSETFTSDADAVFALHRNYIKVKDPANPPMDEYEPMTEIHLLKARTKGSGPAFAQLMFMGEYATFVELTKNEPPPTFGASQ